MSQVDRIAEKIKLGRLLSLGPAALEQYDALDAATLRALREQISDSLFDDSRGALERVASASRLLPNALVASVGERSFGPMLCARITGLLSPERAAALAAHMPDEFLADVAMQLDPRSARGVIAQLGKERVVAVAKVLLARGEHVTLGRFVDFLDLDIIAAVVEVILHEAVLLDIAFYIEAKPRISELAGLLPEPRLRALVLHAGDGDGDTWVASLALMSHLNDDWRRRIGDIVVSEGEVFLTRLVDAAHAHDLWDAMLPIVGSMTDEARLTLAAMPALGRVEVLESVVRAAHRGRLWPDFLPLVAALHVDARRVAASVVEVLPEAMLLDIIDTAHAHRLWPALLGLVAQMTPSEARTALRLLVQQELEVLHALLEAVDGTLVSWGELLPHVDHLHDDDVTLLARVFEDPARASALSALRAAAEQDGRWERLEPLLTR